MITLINNPQNPNNNVNLDEKDLEFFNRINNNITLYGQLPYNIPQQLIIENIKSAARFFYEYHPMVTKPVFYVLTLDKFEDKQYLISTGDSTKNINQFEKIIKLSPRIKVVRKIYDNDQGHNWDDLIDESYSNGPIGLTYGANGGIDSQLFYTEITTKMVEVQALTSMMTTTITFKYNQFDNTLYLRTKPKTDQILIECKATVHIHNLYNNPYFERLVLGYSKRDLKRLIAGHTFQLPGEVTINAEEICNNLEDIETVEQLIKSQSTAGDIILKR